MKNLSRILLVITLIALTSLITFGFSGTTDDEGSIVIVRTTEVVNGIWDNSMTTVYPNGAVEKVELEKLRTKDLNSNLLKINQHLNSIISNGYELNSVAGGNGEGIFVTTYTLSKN